MQLRNDEVLRIKKRELTEVARESFDAPGVDVVNSDVASDPEFAESVKRRLEDVGNHSHGDISAQLDRSPRAEPSSLALLDSVIKRYHSPSG